MKVIADIKWCSFLAHGVKIALVLKNVWSLRRRRGCGHTQRQIFKEIRVE